jgi:outer membrane lipoprotein LolB
MRATRPLLAALSLATLVGCALFQNPQAANDSLSDPTLVEGRLAVQVQALGDQPARSLSAPFTLRGDERAGSLDLTSPIGTMLARAQWQPSVATLTTPEDTRHYPTLDAMADDLLGQAVPMAALLSWLRGQPWGGAALSNPTPSAGPPTAFTQLGWSINLSDYAQGLVVAARDTPAPRVTVRARIERKP